MLQKYNTTYQQSGQSVQDFVNYLDRVSKDLGSKSDVEHTKELLIKLLPDLQHKMTQDHDMLQTLEEVTS